MSINEVLSPSFNRSKKIPSTPQILGVPQSSTPQLSQVCTVSRSGSDPIHPHTRRHRHSSRTWRNSNCRGVARSYTCGRTWAAPWQSAFVAHALCVCRQVTHALLILQPHTSHLALCTPHTSHLTPCTLHTSHLTPHTCRNFAKCGCRCAVCSVCLCVCVGGWVVRTPTERQCKLVTAR